MKKRALVSIILFISFLLLIAAGIFMDHSNAAVAHIAKGVHGRTGAIFAVAAIFHIVYNWKILKSYFKKTRK